MEETNTANTANTVATTSPTTEKGKALRFTLDSEFQQRVDLFESRLNKDRGCKRKVTLLDAIKYFLDKASSDDVKAIQESCLTLEDKIDLDWKRHCEKSGESISKTEYIARKLKLLH